MTRVKFNERETVNWQGNFHRAGFLAAVIKKTTGNKSDLMSFLNVERI